jgi:uncharacterized protein (TIGR02145 family)
MKKSIFISIVFTVLALTIQAQNEIMYIMKNGNVVDQYNISTEIDSIIFYEPEQSGGSFTDTRDGYDYRTIKIGNQEWMAEDLKYLPSVTGPGAISKTTPFYYVYDYEGTDVNAAKATSNYNTYGVLYNWLAAQNACPSGWHLPTDADWQELTNYLGGPNNCAGKLKTSGTAESGTGLWASPNTEATNESGFSALPGGHVYIYQNDGSFIHLGKYGYWWTATETDSNDVWYRRMDYNNKKVLNNLSPKE